MNRRRVDEREGHKSGIFLEVSCLVGQVDVEEEDRSLGKRRKRAKTGVEK